MFELKSRKEFVYDFGKMYAPVFQQKFIKFFRNFLTSVRYQEMYQETYFNWIPYLVKER